MFLNRRKASLAAICTNGPPGVNGLPVRRAETE
jgi:hypothetical protein